MFVKGSRFKKDTRFRKKLRLRKKVFGSDERPRLSVFRSDKHTYAQLISDQTGKTLASASTRDDVVQEELKKLDLGDQGDSSRSSKSVAAAMAVGLVVGRKAKEGKIERIVFDRNGFIYHGRIKALADGARKAGLDF